MPVDHTVPTTGFVIHDGETGFVYSGDTGPTERLWRIAREMRGLKALIVEIADGVNRHPLAVPGGMEMMGSNKVSSTYEEAVALRDWVRPNGPRKVIVPTEFFNTRRVSWVFRKVLKGTGAQIRVKALQPETNYTERDWWHGKNGRTEFGREIIKFIAYRLRF